MYHRVLDPVDITDAHLQPGMYVTSATFEMQVAFLKENFRILFLDELIAKIIKGEEVDRCCAITFDDGWKDNHDNAFPILQKYQVPATIFLATSFIGTNRVFWPEEIANWLERPSWTHEERKDVHTHIEKFRQQMEKCKLDNRESYTARAIELLKQYSYGERNIILDHFRTTNPSSNHSRHMLSWEEVALMANSGLLDFGAHTAGHEILDQLPQADIRKEILQSREDIRLHLGVKAATFAYPNGNYNEDVKQILQEFDFAGAVTTKKGFFHRGTPVLEIPRIGIHEDISNTVSMFQGRILLEAF